MILAIDQGTTGCTCIVFDARAEPIGRAYRELPQHFPEPGRVEHDANDIWELTQATAGEALEKAGARPGGVEAVGIACQRETVCVWDPQTGEPLHRAIVWQDRRTAERCAQLREEGREQLIRERTGLVLDPYFSASKMEWLLENVEGLRERARDGRAVFGTVDAWLLYKLTGAHVTDVSNASRTMLLNLETGRWDGELLELWGVPERALPQVRASAGRFAMTRPEALHGHAAPVTGVAGDQQAALFGQACGTPGMGKNTYGTGSFVLLNVGSTPPAPAPGLLGTVAWAVDGGGRGGGGEGAGLPAGMGGAPESAKRPAAALEYALEASIFVTGAAVQWLRDGLGIVADAADTEALAETLESNEQVYFVPALTGLGSPHWDPHARGTIVGLTRGSTRAHLARAALEAMAYQTVDAVRAMERGAGVALSELRADGGATANRWLMQFQADVLGVPVLVPELAETTARGAALLAGVGAGIFTLADVADGWHARDVYEPRMSEGERECLLAGWRGALDRARTAPPAPPA